MGWSTKVFVRARNLDGADWGLLFKPLELPDGVNFGHKLSVLGEWLEVVGVSYDIADCVRNVHVEYTGRGGEATQEGWFLLSRGLKKLGWNWWQGKIELPEPPEEEES